MINNQIIATIKIWTHDFRFNPHLPLCSFKVALNKIDNVLYEIIFNAHISKIAEKLLLEDIEKRKIIKLTAIKNHLLNNT